MGNNVIIPFPDGEAEAGGGGEGALGKCPRVIHGGGGRGSQGFQPGGLTPVEVTGMLTSGLKLASPQVH